MPLTLWCVSDEPVLSALLAMAESAGFHPKSILLPGSAPYPTPFLLREWSDRVVNEIGDRDGVLLVYAHLGSQRSASYGFCLVEQVWQVCPIAAVIAVIDPKASERPNTHRIRDLEGFPIAATLAPGDPPTLNGEPQLVVWDVLDPEYSLRAACELAWRIARRSRKIERNRLATELLRAGLLSETSVARHSLQELQSGLRILEGAFLQGWFSPSQVSTAFEHLASGRTSAVKDVLSQLDKITKRIPQVGSGRSYAGPSLGGQIWVCDEGWESAGWSAILPPLFRSALCLETDFVPSLDFLRARLDTHSPGDRLRPECVLLDVYLSENGPDRSGTVVTVPLLRELKKQHPDIGFILFTSDTSNGYLVREGYELGFRFFFKELDEARRNTSEYAQRLVKTVSDMLSQQQKASSRVEECFIVSVDMEGFSTVSNLLREQLGNNFGILALIRQIEDMLLMALEQIGGSNAENWIEGTGDGALLRFSSANQAVSFYDALKSLASDRSSPYLHCVFRRRFRVGVAMDRCVVIRHCDSRGRLQRTEIGGYGLSIATRLQDGGKKGGMDFLICERTYAALPLEQRERFAAAPILVRGKRKESFVAHRLA